MMYNRFTISSHAESPGTHLTLELVQVDCFESVGAHSTPELARVDCFVLRLQMGCMQEQAAVLSAEASQSKVRRLRSH